MTTETAMPVNVFPDDATNLVHVRNPSGKMMFFLLLASPDAKGLVVFRGRQSKGQFSAVSDTTYLPRLPHAVQIAPKVGGLIALQFDGELEVCRSMESGTVTVTADYGAEATAEHCAALGKLLDCNSG